MNPQKNFRVVSTIALVIFLVFTSPWEQNLTISGASESITMAHQQYVPHEPIEIYSNADFAAYGFPGAGTEENPYLIEGLNITREGGSNEVLIDIGDTTAYFCIRNNVLTGLIRSYTGITLGGTIHGMVDSNFITNCKWGILVYSANNNTITRNTVSDCDYDGIYLYGENNHVTYNTIFDCKQAGIKLEDLNSHLTHNTIFNCVETGIKVDYSRLTFVANNTISDCGLGITLNWSEQITISDNTVSKCQEGLYLHSSTQNTLVRNQFVDTGGLVIELWLKPDYTAPYIGPIGEYLQATVAENKVNDRPLVYWQNARGGSVPSDAGQIILLNCTGIEVTNGNLSQVKTGVFTAFSSNLNIHHNLIANCRTEGIVLHASNSTVVHNTINNCRTEGIVLQGSRNCYVAHNNVTNCTQGGIKLDDAEQNIISNNTVSDCGQGEGIKLNGSPQNTLVGNQLVNNGLVITGLYLLNRLGNIVNSVSNHLQVMVADNRVNDRPLIFWQNVEGGSVPSGAGQVILLNCTGVEVTGGNISGVFRGVFTAFCENLTIHHNTIVDCQYGIYLHVSDNTMVTHNNISRSQSYGIYLSSYSLYLHTKSLDNTVMWNDFLSNNLGGDSQAFDAGKNTVFAYNYWDDHRNIDQNADGIADRPYAIEGISNRDKFPLIAPASSHYLSIPTITDPKNNKTLQGTVTIQWMASNDSVGHSFTYTVSYSPDDGYTWIPLVSGLSTPRYEWDTTTVADGSSYRIQVIAICSNGLTTEDLSDFSFTIYNPETTTSVPETQSPEITTSVPETHKEAINVMLVSLYLLILLLIQKKRKSL